MVRNTSFSGQSTTRTHAAAANQEFFRIELSGPQWQPSARVWPRSVFGPFPRGPVAEATGSFRCFASGNLREWQYPATPSAGDFNLKLLLLLNPLVKLGRRSDHRGLALMAFPQGPACVPARWARPDCSTSCMRAGVVAARNIRRLWMAPTRRVSSLPRGNLYNIDHYSWLNARFETASQFAGVPSIGIADYHSLALSDACPFGSFYTRQLDRSAKAGSDEVFAIASLAR
jgi:hypothetical protein